MTATEAERAILKDGWRSVLGASGSHRQYVHPTKPGRVTIAHHAGRIIKAKTLNQILRQAGLTVDQFRALLLGSTVAGHTVLPYHDEEEGGYAVLTPVLGLATQGESIDEALAMAKEAAELQIRGLVEDGEPVLEEEAPPIVAAIDVAVPATASA